MTKALQIAGLVIAGIVLWTMFSIGNTANKGDESAKTFSAVRNQIYLGMTTADVRAVAGEPEDTQHDEMQNYEGGTDTTDYWYYGVLSTEGWQLVFDNDKLRSINQT